VSLEAALARQQQGDLAGAERICRELLSRQPGDADALHLLGLVALQRGQPQAAVAAISQSLQSDPAQPVAHLNLGVAWRQVGRLQQALECFVRALALEPDNAEANNNRADALLELGRPEEALRSVERALAVKPNFPMALNNCGNALRALGRTGEALASYDQALRLDPLFTRALNNRGSALRDVGRLEEALGAFEQTLRLDPHNLTALYNHGNALLELQRYEPALRSYEQLLALQPNDADALTQCGIALLQLQRAEQALLRLERAVQLAPGLPLALNNLGNALRSLQRPEEALRCYQQALMQAPDSAEILANCGLALADLQRYGPALQRYECALKQRPDIAQIWCGRADALRALRRAPEALADYEQALRLQPTLADALFGAAMSLLELYRWEQALGYLQRVRALDPNYPHAQGYRLHARLRICEWGELARDRAEVMAAVAQGLAADVPFSFLALTDSAAAQLQCARSFAADRYPARAAASQPVVAKHERIRLAYVSGDLGQHAVARLLVGVFERHDRQRFEVNAIALRAADERPFGRRVRSAFDRFVDVSSKGDAEIAALMREMQIDIAIDLAGFTEVQRTGLFARRCAPIQVNYLGFPGTMGAAYMDYIVADEFIIPQGSQRHYAEQVVYLPDCFQSADDRRAMPVRPARAQLGLPESALVCCSLNNSYKYNERMLDIWARVLRQVPGSVLWLLAPDATTERNLRREAAARGIVPDRLHFSRRVPYEDYLSQLGCADLYLDTLPFNAGATAGDVLWAGVPLLTCAGDAFAARMAGSVLLAAGVPELVTFSREEYERRALELLGAPTRLAELRRRVEAARTSSALFDTERYCRALEAAYEVMWRRSQGGESPAAIRLGAAAEAMACK